MRKFYTLLVFCTGFLSFGQIDAVDDIISVTSNQSYNVLINDTLNGNPATVLNTDITPITSGPISVNSEGVVIVAPNTTSGTYTITYQLCEVDVMTGLAIVPSNSDTGCSSTRHRPTTLPTSSWR